MQEKTGTEGRSKVYQGKEGSGKSGMNNRNKYPEEGQASCEVMGSCDASKDTEAAKS